MPGGFDPFADDCFEVDQRLPVGGAVGCTAGQLRRFRDERPILLAPVNDNFVFNHVRRRGQSAPFPAVFWGCSHGHLSHPRRVFAKGTHTIHKMTLPVFSWKGNSAQNDDRFEVGQHLRGRYGPERGRQGQKARGGSRKTAQIRGVA